MSARTATSVPSSSFPDPSGVRVGLVPNVFSTANLAALILASLVVFGMGGPLQAQSPADHVLVVEVRDGSRADRGVTQAQVTLQVDARVDTRVDARVDARAMTRLTGANGRAAFGGLPAGTYRITVQAPGFESLEQELRIPLDAGAGLLTLTLVPRPFTLDEVVGTASPLRSGVTYTAAQTFEREELTRRLDASIGTMLDGEPGVAMRSLGSAPTRPVIRGFDGDRILVLENGERMGDIGESSADHAVALDPLAVERIEIVRGPASLLYGSGALGGVVNLTTRDLPRSWSRGLTGAAQLQGASMNRSGSGAAALTWGADDWASTFRLSARKTGDLRTPDGRIADTALSSLDGSLGFVRTWDALRLGISGSFVDREYGIPEAWDDPDEEVFLTMERQSVQARLDWEPSHPGAVQGFELRTRVSRFFQQEIERAYVRGPGGSGPGGSGLGGSGLGGSGPGGAERAGAGSLEDEVGLEYDARSASATATLRHGPLLHGALRRGPLRIFGEGGEGGEGAVGLALRARQMDVGGEEAFFPGVDERSAALFTFQEAPLTRDLSLQVGGRVEVNVSEARPSARFPFVDEGLAGGSAGGSGGGSAPGSAGASARGSGGVSPWGSEPRRTGTALSGSVGLNWRPGGGWELGAQVARAHRVPLAEELFANGPHLAAGVFEIGSTALADEVSRGLDLFVRRDFARGSVELAGFSTWIRDYVAFQPLGQVDEASGFSVFQYQGTDARMHGAELSAELQLNEVWRVGAGVDVVKGTRADGSADPLPAIPPFRSRLEVEADPGRWWAGTTLRAVAAQDRVASGELATDGYVLVDAQVGLRLDALLDGLLDPLLDAPLDAPGSHAIILRIDNALNTGYRDHLSRLPERDMLMPGRNVSVVVRWAF